VYFGLKAGLTFSTSIPAAVISMAILRGFRDATVQENNIVQTVASAAGTLSSIIFVLPGLIMIGYWTDFPFWTSFWICALGGILGVMYSIPLRRALVTQSDLPYPEGVACAEVLKVGSGDEGKHASDIEHGRAGLLAVLWGSIVSAVFAVIVATQVFAADVAQTFRIGRRGAVSGYDFSLSFALLAIGHLVGLSVGIAMLIGAFIGWGWGVPHYSALVGDFTTAAARLGARLLRKREWTRRAHDYARNRRCGLCPFDELLRLGGLRLHGGPDWFVEQSPIGHWHPGGDRCCLAARSWREAIRFAGCEQSFDGIRAFH